eukprot:CAMPEP_0116928812 /NCGR_PEP_ID=MMETSP0467-20121206/26198_1 /TAXON_ID=283647 /ORGANISM="Mesodinium pulex, Strain SPMC105" /LENGTH=115 /DNA_ID=CAMNT_0004608641 /DNA_START=307 /DNA_END=654 /DNA_ORIENTATION=+
MVDPVFEGETEITTTTINGTKKWINSTGAMRQLLCNIRIENGVHEMQVQSINDKGGYAVIGITDDKQTDYYNCIGVAGNSFNTNHKVKKIGTWNEKLKWGKNDLISFKVDSTSLL